MRAPVGAVVSITYDTDAPIAAGDWLRTSSERAYHVLEVRTVQRGPHAGKRHRLRCLVAEAVPHGAPPNAKVHPLCWYRRERSRAG